jgi:pyruvate dehydrogenase E1 component alpha subunit
MLRCRLAGGRARLLHKQSGPNGSYAPANGLEAVAAGTTIDLLSQDTLAPAIWAQAPLSLIKPSLRVAPGFAQAIARAENNKASKNNNIVVAFSSGTSESSEGWLNALDEASVHRLPILFVSWSAQSTLLPPLESTSIRNLKSLKNGSLSLPSISVDASDVVAVYRVACEAITHARRGNGATLIQCIRAGREDPLSNMENYLTGKGLFTPLTKRQFAAAMRAELDAKLPNRAR